MRNALFILAAASLAGCQAPEPRENKQAPAPGTRSETKREHSETKRAAGPPAAAAEIAATIPAGFQGRYDETSDACGRPSEYRLTITGAQLRFHESIGTVRTVSLNNPRLIQVSADYQGEGERWSNVRELRLSADRSRLTVEGEGMKLTRIRCP